MDTIAQLQQYIDQSSRIVFFGGAGVSTESGIKDFRSVDGLYHMKYKYNPETILSHSFFLNHTEEFFEFYMDKIVQPTQNAAPNTAHTVLAQLEAQGKLSAVITQNIDGLHQAAGSKNVFELHGSVLRNYCEKCGAFFDLKYVMEHTGVPKCNKCQSTVKPDVVLYEEGLDQRIITESINHIRQAEVLIVGGTSLSVYPAAGLVDYFTGEKLIVINMSPTPRDNYADLVIKEPIADVFSSLNL